MKSQEVVKVLEYIRGGINKHHIDEGKLRDMLKALTPDELAEVEEVIKMGINFNNLKG
jgi:hypothetical protein